MKRYEQLPRLVAGHACVFNPPLACSQEQPACKAPNELIRLTQPLTHTAQRLANFELLTIVAIGSSSTAGAGASSPAASYPSRLAAELKEQFPGHPITVINRGVNGEEARALPARFPAQGIDE